MSTVFVATARCAGCGGCLATCPERALRPAASGALVPLVTLVERCTGCGECAELCPVDAFEEIFVGVAGADSRGGLAGVDSRGGLAGTDPRGGWVL